MQKILLIEDNKDIRNTLDEILTLSGYEIITAEDGVIGVEKALSENPDLILCDVMMPRLDGFGTLRILNQKPETSSIPFIFLTANSEKNDFRKGMSLGADDYITKPVDLQDLLNAVDTRLKKSKYFDKTFINDFIGTKKITDNNYNGYRELIQLTQNKKYKTYHRKSFLFQEEEIPRQIFYVVRGKVKVFRTNDFGKEFITNIYKTGDFVGCCDLLKEGNYQKSAVALEEAEIGFVSKEDFFKLLNSNRDFTVYFIKMLVNNIFEKESQLVSIAYNSIRKRVANTLVRLHKKYQNSESANIDLLRDDLACMVGTTKESISRMLSDLKSENLIDIDSSGVIKVLNEKGLVMLPN